jgi:hypothetical protein
MPVPIRVYSADKLDSSDFTLMLTANNQEFLIEPGFTISELKIDPDYWLVSKTSKILKTPSVEITGDIQVYPNPVTDILMIYIPPGQLQLKTEIFTLSGQKLIEFSGDQSEYDWSGLPGGTYLIRIVTSKQQFEKLLIKN